MQSNWQEVREPLAKISKTLLTHEKMSSLAATARDYFSKCVARSLFFWTFVKA